MSALDPNIIALEKKLLSQYHGNSKITTSLTSGQTNVQSIQGKESIHARYPNEIEYYACAIEIIDSQGKSKEFFSFPVMPTNININKQNNVNVEKTLAGVVVHKNSTFIPFDISISGNFGRRFRRYGNWTFSTDIEENESLQTKGKQLKAVVIGDKKPYDGNYKTGYGQMKILERILMKSNELDTYDQPQFMLFYNLSFNQIFVVEVMSNSFSQSKEMNGIWNYNISFKCVAPYNAIKSNTKIKGTDGKVSKLLDFNKLYKNFSQNSVNIDSILTSNVNGEINNILGRNTELRTLMNKVINSRAFNIINNKYGIVGNDERNAIYVLQSLSSNPVNFSKQYIINHADKLLTIS